MPYADLRELLLVFAQKTLDQQAFKSHFNIMLTYYFPFLVTFLIDPLYIRAKFRMLLKKEIYHDVMGKFRIVTI